MATDLASRHELIGDVFAWPDTPEQWKAYQLSEEQVRFYNEQGYLPGIQILSDDQAEQLREELSQFFDPQHPGRELWYEYHTNESADPAMVLFHALGAWRIQPGFHDLLWNPAFTVPASQLLGGSVRFWHDQLFCKPAKHGGVVAWHQDYSYWTRTQPVAHLSCWIALDDSTAENGCVHYVPGSQRWDLLPITGLAGRMVAIREVLNDDQWERFQQPVAAELKKGQGVFHHPLMIHGSFANRTDRPRRATVINAIRDGVRSVSDQPLLAGVPPIPPGEVVAGQFFPLLLDPTAVHLQ